MTSAHSAEEPPAAAGYSNRQRASSQVKAAGSRCASVDALLPAAQFSRLPARRVPSCALPA